MSKQDMTEKRFKEIIASYGTAQERWPVEERAPALLFIKQNENAQDLLDTARKADALLNFMPKPKPADKAFLERLSAITPVRKAAPIASTQSWSLSDFLSDILSINLQGFMPRAVGLASICALGIMLGLSNVARYDNTVITVDASELMFGTSSLGSDLEEIN